MQHIRGKKRAKSWKLSLSDCNVGWNTFSSIVGEESRRGPPRCWQRGREMRNKFLSSVASSALVAVLATFAGGAIAADLAVKAPSAQYMPAWSWAGFYAGVHDAAVRGGTT